MTTSQPGRIDPSGWTGTDDTDPCGPPPKPSARGSADHCIFDGVRNVLLCERCKGEFAVKLPIDGAAFMVTLDAFINLHKWC